MEKPQVNSAAFEPCATPLLQGEISQGHQYLCEGDFKAFWFPPSEGRGCARLLAAAGVSNAMSVACGVWAGGGWGVQQGIELQCWKSTVGSCAWWVSPSWAAWCPLFENSCVHPSATLLSSYCPSIGKELYPGLCCALMHLSLLQGSQQVTWCYAVLPEALPHGCVCSLLPPCSPPPLPPAQGQLAAAGSPGEFLAVGLSSVRRPRGYYLPETLQSLFKQSSEEELQEMVVVVHLADADPRWNAQVAADISNRFAHHILLGRLVLIHAPREFYPTLEGLKRNYNDPEARVKFRSKQNVDYAFLVTFAANLSSYYLMIEDDVLSAKSFFTAIRKAVASQEGSNWATLEFSKLGYIGKLYRSSDLPRLAHFLLLFYQEMPCDWLLDHFRLLLTQKDVIRFKPSLFQHMGLYSSFQGTINRLEDDEFQADAMDLPDNPPAAVFTSMLVFENYEPSKAYSTATGYFWGKNPTVGSIFSVVFHQPARVSRVRVQTGSNERRGDFLRAGVLELGRGRRADGRDCSVYTTVGSFEKGNLERRGLEKEAPNPVDCVRIRVTQSQSEWLIIQSIDIWTAGT